MLSLAVTNIQVAIVSSGTFLVLQKLAWNHGKHLVD